MTASIFRKKYKARFLVSLGFMTGALFLFNCLFAGPRMGFFYDFLMRYRSAPPVSPELALIETGFIPEDQSAAAERLVDPATTGQVILSLVEAGAQALIIQTPVLGASLGSAKTEDELRKRFSGEFTILEQNIRNLFQGIRTGSIAPDESEQFVAGLIRLTEQGKERLISSFLDKNESDTVFMERAARVFGNVWQSEDTRVSLIREGGAFTPEGNGRRYSRSRPDPDGVFRRIAPILPPAPGRGGDVSGADQAAADTPGEVEHIAYTALKGRFNRVEPETSGGRKRMRFSGSGGEYIIVLDKEGNILVEKPRSDAGFKRIPLPVFLEYARAERELAALLEEAKTGAYFTYLNPEDYPVALYHYSRELREEMLEKPDDEKKGRWLNSRSRYLKSVENYLNGVSEAKLVNAYEETIAREDSAGPEFDRLVAMRNDTINSFIKIREKYEKVLSLRSEIAGAAAGSLCIMGPVSAPHPVLEGSNAAGGILPRLIKTVFSPDREPNPSDAEASAILANSILTGRSITTPADFYLLLWSGGLAFLMLFLLRKTWPLFTLITGSLLILTEVLIFSFGFIYTGYWIDPLQPAFTAAAGILTSFFIALRIEKKEAGQFRLAYGRILAPPYLRQAIRAGYPRPEDTLKVKAAVITVRQPSILSGGNREDIKAGAVLLKDFRRSVCRYFARFGGACIGAGEDLVMIAFGSPLERIYLNRVKYEVPYEDEINARSNNTPASKAVGAVMDLALRSSKENWYFGIDTGECAFTMMEPGAYTAFGSPVVRSKLLASIAPRYKSRILATSAVIEKTDGVISQKLDALKEKNGSQEAFYKLLTGREN
jgi:hypothetical protein